MSLCWTVLPSLDLFLEFFSFHLALRLVPVSLSYLSCCHKPTEIVAFFFSQSRSIVAHPFTVEGNKETYVLRNLLDARHCTKAVCLHRVPFLSSKGSCGINFYFPCLIDKQTRAWKNSLTCSGLVTGQQTQIQVCLRLSLPWHWCQEP